LENIFLGGEEMGRYFTLVALGTLWGLSQVFAD